MASGSFNMARASRSSSIASSSNISTPIATPKGKNNGNPNGKKDPNSVIKRRGWTVADDHQLIKVVSADAPWNGSSTEQNKWTQIVQKLDGGDGWKTIMPFQRAGRDLQDGC